MELDDYVRTVEDFPEDGVNFKDITPMLEDPDAYRQSVEELVGMLEGEDVDRIGAFDARGFLYGPSVAQEMEKPFFPIRKEGKLPYEKVQEEYGLEYGEDTLEMHEDAVEEGDRVALIDDVLATGGTMEAGASMVERLGGEAVYCGVVIELEALGARDRLEEQGYEVGSLLSYGDGT